MRRVRVISVSDGEIIRKRSAGKYIFLIGCLALSGIYFALGGAESIRNRFDEYQKSIGETEFVTGINYAREEVGTYLDNGGVPGWVAGQYGDDTSGALTPQGAEEVNKETEKFRPRKEVTEGARNAVCERINHKLFGICAGK